MAQVTIANPDQNTTLDLGGTTITEIPDKLFQKLNKYGEEEPCENLVGIILPEGLKSIGEQAFSACIGLTEIEIPSGTTSIGDYAFYNTGIKSAKIPASIETMGAYAFSYDPYLNFGQQKIETVEFGGTLAQWQNLYVGKDDDRNYYGLQHAVVTTSDGGISCTSDNFEEVLKTFSAGSEAHIAIRVGYREGRLEFTVLRDVMKNYSDIKVHLDLSKSKTRNENEKFKDCTNLVGFEFSTLDTETGYYDFEGCTGLKSITVPANITKIENGAFRNCTGLEEVTFLGNISAADQPFEGCTKLSKVNFPEGLTGIPNGICYSLTALTSIEIPASVTEIGQSAFKGTGLTSVEIPAGVTRLGLEAFGSIESLTSVTINSVDIVLAHPFLYSANLKDIYYAGTMDDWNKLKDKVSLAESEGTAVELGFSSAPLTTATIHCSDGAIASVNATASQAATVISGFTEAGTYTVTVTGGITGSDLTAIKNAMSGNPDAKIVLDLSGTTGLTEIPERAFWFCSSLAGIKLPSTLTSIGNYAFAICENLTDIEIPEGVTSIGDQAFNSCKSLTDVKIPEGVTSIGDCAFLSCPKLAALELPSTLTSIGKSAFDGCESLTSIKIPEGITSISAGSFQFCYKLASLELPSTLTSIDESAFKKCESLTSVKIPDGVTSIGDETFYGCGITTIELPASLTSIGDGAFRYTDNLSTINFGGTKAEWNAITKGAYNSERLNKATIHCTDGDITH